MDRRKPKPNVDLTEPKLPVLRVEEYYVEVELSDASEVDTKAVRETANIATIPNCS